MVKGLDCFACVSESLDGERSCEDPLIPKYVVPLKDCKVPIPIYSNVTEAEGGYSHVDHDKTTSLAQLAKKAKAYGGGATPAAPGNRVVSYAEEPSTHCLKIIGTIGGEHRTASYTPIMRFPNT